MCSKSNCARLGHIILRATGECYNLQNKPLVNRSVAETSISVRIWSQSIFKASLDLVLVTRVSAELENLRRQQQSTEILSCSSINPVFINLYGSQIHTQLDHVFATHHLTSS